VPLNYAGPHGFLAGGSMDLRFFYRLGASNLARRPLCGGVKSEAFVSTYGAVPLMRPEHVAAAQLILVWGNNVTVSQMHLMSYINAAVWCQAGDRSSPCRWRKPICICHRAVVLACPGGWRTGGPDHAFIAQRARS
jgi:hypothetical protein